jgi:hypothetical protein
MKWNEAPHILSIDDEIRFISQVNAVWNEIGMEAKKRVNVEVKKKTAQKNLHCHHTEMYVYLISM